MKKRIASMAFAAAVLGGGAVEAAPAPVDVHVVISSKPGVTTLSLPDEPTVQLSQNDVGIFVDFSGVKVSAVSLHLYLPADPSEVLLPTALVSPLYSALTGEFIIVVAPPAGPPFNGLAGDTGWFLLGNFTGAHFTPCGVGACAPANGVYEDPANLGPTVVDALNNGIPSDFQIVPEPDSLVLLGLGAAGLALFRRSAVLG